jgi:hypothetical protein
MPPVELKLTILARTWPQTYALDRTTAGTVLYHISPNIVQEFYPNLLSEEWGLPYNH